MADVRVVELRGKRIEITDAGRAKVREELPEISLIADEDLQRKVTDAWTAAIASSSFSCLSDMKPSGNYNTPPLRHGTQIGRAHV